MRPRRACVGLALLGLSMSGAPRVAADEPAAAPGAMETRRIDVGAVLTGRRDFRGDRGPEPVPADQVNDEQQPLFGDECDEETPACGPAESLLDRIRADLPAGALAAEGAVLEIQGPRTLVVRAAPAVVDAVSAFVERVTRGVLAPVTLDVVALRGPASEAEGEGGLAGAVGRGALMALAAARATSIVGPRFVGRSGGVAAYVQDEDVLVAKEAMAPDPIVGVFPDGLQLTARAIAASDRRVRVDLETWIAVPGPVRTSPAVEADPVETVEVETHRVAAVLDLVPGAWTVLAAGGDVCFGVRASVRPLETAAAPTLVAPPAPAFGAPGPLVFRMLDAQELGERARNDRGFDVVLSPTRWTPPKPPDLPEAEFRFPMERLVDRLRAEVDPAGWKREGVSIDLKNGLLVVRQDEAHLASAARWLDALKESTRRTWRVRADLVTLPLASLPEWWTGLGDGEALLAHGTAALLARPGARAVDSGALRLASGQRRAAVGGERRSYVADYDVEIAEKTSIGNPIVRQALVGLSFDVEGAPTLGGAALVCQVRLDRSTWRGSREVATRHGAIECPSLGLLRWKGNAVVPLGATRVVAAGIDGGEVTLVLLTANGA